MRVQKILNEIAQLQSSSRPVADKLEDKLKLIMREKCKAYLVQRNLHKISLSRLLVDPKMSAQMQKLVYPIAEETIARKLKLFKDDGQINQTHDISMIAKMIQMECVGILTIMCIQKNVDENSVFQMVDTFASVFAQGLH